jgi:hypothetical protein
MLDKNELPRLGQHDYILSLPFDRYQPEKFKKAFYQQLRPFRSILYD